jgi:UDP-N-acetylmuramoylalanine--D-glutamate ligase
MQQRNRKATVLGLGRSGISAAEYLVKKGAQVFVSDGGVTNPEREAEAERLRQIGCRVEIGEHSEDALNFGDFILSSPGISPNSEVIRRAYQRVPNKEVICDVELAFRETEIPMIGVTGTNGKSTTCALISHILTVAGKSAPACGNIGVPILDELSTPHDYLVVEVSSFQLHYTKLFAPDIAVWLNLTPDHVDWHGSLEEYVAAKSKLFANMRSDQFAVLNEDDPMVSGFNLPAEPEIFPFSALSSLDYGIQGAFIKDDFLWYRIDGRSRLVCGKDELKIIGRHNLENALAAISVAALVGVPEEKIAEGLQSFNALEHRLEYVETVDSVRFFNDSKATNPTSTIKALEAFAPEKIVLILGGKDKGTALGDLMTAIARYANDVVLLGEAKERFHKALKDFGYEPIHTVDSLEQAIELGSSLKRGPVVLSPACASFDMFKNYEERGRVFKNLVHKRAEMAASR